MPYELDVPSTRVEPNELGGPSTRATPSELDVSSVWVVSQQTLEVANHGIAPEHNSGREVYQKSSRSCEKQIGKGISDLT